MYCERVNAPRNKNKYKNEYTWFPNSLNEKKNKIKTTGPKLSSRHLQNNEKTTGATRPNERTRHHVNTGVRLVVHALMCLSKDVLVVKQNLKFCL